MSNPSNADFKSDLCVSIQLSEDTKQVLLDVIASEFAHMESGEVRARLEAAFPPKSKNPETDLWEIDNVSDVWNEDELLAAFEVSHFDAPYAHVIRKEDGQRGTVMFIDSPRFYFAFISTQDAHGRRPA
jgi:hypothetical protein